MIIDPSAGHDSVRVIIAGLPSLEAGIIRHVLSRGGVRVVAEVDDRTALRPTLDATRCEVVIVPAADARIAAVYRHLLQERPTVRLIALSIEDGRADMFEIRLVGNDIGSADVIDAIRAALARSTRDDVDYTQTEDT